MRRVWLVIASVGLYETTEEIIIACGTKREAHRRRLELRTLATKMADALSEFDEEHPEPPIDDTKILDDGDNGWDWWNEQRLRVRKPYERAAKRLGLQTLSLDGVTTETVSCRFVKGGIAT
jgi:hypothetical protein